MRGRWTGTGLGSRRIWESIITHPHGQNGRGSTSIGNRLRIGKILIGRSSGSRIGRGLRTCFNPVSVNFGLKFAPAGRLRA
jgi:hypothetical protein